VVQVATEMFIGPLPTSTFPENFMQIRSEVFCAKLLIDKQTDKQTDNDINISCLAEVMKTMCDILYCKPFLRLQTLAPIKAEYSDSLEVCSFSSRGIRIRSLEYC